MQVGFALVEKKNAVDNNSTVVDINAICSSSDHSSSGPLFFLKALFQIVIASFSNGNIPLQRYWCSRQSQHAKCINTWMGDIIEKLKLLQRIQK